MRLQRVTGPAYEALRDAIKIAAPAAPTDSKPDDPLIDEGSKTDAGVRDKALEDAARLVMSGCGYSWDQIADAIRALKSSPQAPKTEGEAI